MIKDLIIKILSIPGLWGVAIVLLMALITFIVGKTKTKKDDEYWAIAKGFIVEAFGFAEKIIKDGMSILTHCNAGLLEKTHFLV